MPNHCFNDITIKGPASTIKALWETAHNNGKTENIGLLQAMVPMPKALIDTVSPSPSDGSQPLVEGYTNWYDWRIENWGTKWDIYDHDLRCLTLTEVSFITGPFCTAWGPPIEAYSIYLSKHNDVDIYSTYEEEGMEFAGIYDNGNDRSLNNITELCDQVINKTVPLEKQSPLFQELDRLYDFVENRTDDMQNEEFHKQHKESARVAQSSAEMFVADLLAGKVLK